MRGRSIGEWIEAAERELARFGRQPPQGLRAYVRGRNQRRAVIEAPKERPEHG